MKPAKAPAVDAGCSVGENGLSPSIDRRTAPTDEGNPASHSSAVALPPRALPADRNRAIYYRNKLELSQELGVLPFNIPFVFDVFVGGDYAQKPLHYTLIPVVNSLRWQVDNLWAPSVLRGNTEVTMAFSHTAIPRGPESHYEAFDLGFRRNFVPRNWSASPYFEGRVGVGQIDAQGPHRVRYAQGQDTTFTLMMGSGARYNFGPKYSMAVGLTYMHVSNLYLSEPKYTNNGINVYGPIVGFNMRVGRPRPAPTL